jgi:hypothetical protein
LRIFRLLELEHFLEAFTLLVQCAFLNRILHLRLILESHECWLKANIVQASIKANMHVSNNIPPGFLYSYRLPP